MIEFYLFGVACLIGVIYLSTMKEIEMRAKDTFEEIEKKVEESEKKKWLM